VSERLTLARGPLRGDDGAMRTVVFTLALVAAPFMVAAKPPLSPPSDPEQTVRALVRAMNGGDLRAFVERHFLNEAPDGVAVDERLQRLDRLRRNFGALTIRSVDTSKPGEPVALVQSGRTERWSRMTVLFGGGTPPRIRGLRLDPAPAPDAPGRRLSDAEIVAELKGYVERMARRDTFSGAVLLAKAGKPLYRAAFGEANKDFAVRNTVDTKFNLGSMNKMFTAVAILQLVEAGKLSLDDPLGKHLEPGAMRPEVLEKVRIEHLLTHTSGLGSYFTPEWDAQSRARFRTVDDWMATVKDETLKFEPGTRWSYSNTGMLVLGKVIEVVGGQDYFEYVRARITGPAKMVNTDAYELDRVNRNLAVGYDAEPAARGVEYHNNIFQHVIRGGPAGGGYSTVEDLTRFAEALKAGRLVSKESVRSLTTPKPELGAPDWGFGFALEEGGKIVGHGGAFNGISAQLDIYLGQDYTVAVLSNYGDGATPIVEKARDLLLPGRGR
jgi:CubicO group peptidase (beta-lactamase class C family)